MTAVPTVPASELDDDEVLADAVAEHTDHPEPDVAWVSTADPRRWGFIDADGVFVPVPKPPLVMAGMKPPCTVHLYGGERSIVVEPQA